MIGGVDTLGFVSGFTSGVGSTAGGISGSGSTVGGTSGSGLTSGGTTGSGLTSGGTTGNLSIALPFSNIVLQSTQYKSPVYPSSSCVASFTPRRSVCRWRVVSKSPYSFPHFSQIAFFEQVAMPPVCSCGANSPSI